MQSLSNMWKWWIRDVMSCTPNTYGPNQGKVDKDDLAFAVFMTTILGVFGLFFGLLLLGAIIASKGVVLFILLIVGALGYGVWKAVEGAAYGDDS